MWTRPFRFLSSQQAMRYASISSLDELIMALFDSDQAWDNFYVGNFVRTHQKEFKSYIYMLQKLNNKIIYHAKIPICQ